MLDAGKQIIIEFVAIVAICVGVHVVCQRSTEEANEAAPILAPVPSDKKKRKKEKGVLKKKKKYELGYFEKNKKSEEETL